MFCSLCHSQCPDIPQLQRLDREGTSQSACRPPTPNSLAWALGPGASLSPARSLCPLIVVGTAHLRPASRPPQTLHGLSGNEGHCPQSGFRAHSPFGLRPAAGARAPDPGLTPPPRGPISGSESCFLGARPICGEDPKPPAGTQQERGACPSPLHTQVLSAARSLRLRVAVPPLCPKSLHLDGSSIGNHTVSNEAAEPGMWPFPGPACPLLAPSPNPCWLWMSREVQGLRFASDAFPSI